MVCRMKTKGISTIHTGWWYGFLGLEAIVCSVGGGNDVDPDCALPKDILLLSPQNLAKRQIRKAFVSLQIHPVIRHTTKCYLSIIFGHLADFWLNRRHIVIAEITTMLFLFYFYSIRIWGRQAKNANIIFHNFYYYISLNKNIDLNNTLYTSII